MFNQPTAIARDAAVEAGVAAPAHSGAFVGLFAVAGLGVALVQPDAAATAVFAAFCSAMSAGMALIAAHDEAESTFHKSMRAGVRLVAPVLVAALLWLAIASMQHLFGQGPQATAAALPAFLALVLGESVIAAAVQFALARLAGSDPGAPAALLIADKYAGFAGELR